MAERVYCLYRVSTNKQVDHDENNQADIPMQRKACHEFAAKMGWIIVGEEQETGVSGYKVSADDRDKLQFVPVISTYFIARHTGFLLLSHNEPTILRCELMAGFPLHRDVCLVVLIMIDLLACGDSV